MDTELSSSYSINDHKTNSNNNGEGLQSVDSNVEIQSLREELELLNTEFLKANEERAKAAEYGLVLLEQKQALQYKNEELAILYDRTKQELDTSTMTLRQVQRDYEKRVKHVERQREELVSEMDGRERELLSRLENLEEEKRSFARTIKKMSSQHDYISENNGLLNLDNERLKREMSVQKEEMRLLKRKSHETDGDMQQLTSELDTTRDKLTQLLNYEQTVLQLNDQNQSLQNSVSVLQDQVDNMADERDELERQNRDIVHALNEEKEVKSFLETKLRQEVLRSPHRVNWLTESTADLTTPNGHVPMPDSSPIPVSASAPTSPTFPVPPVSNYHSTPRHTVPSLFSEIETSVNSSSQIDNDRSINSRISELNNKIASLDAYNNKLLQNVTEMTAQVDKWKKRCKKFKEESNSEMESLMDELSAKKEITEQLTSQLSSVNKERTSFEIEIEGQREEMKRAKELAKMENEKLEKEFLEAHRKCDDLQTRVTELEEKLGMSVTNGERMETVLVNSAGEVSTMIAEITNVQRAMMSLQRESDQIINGEVPNNEGLIDTYDMSVMEGKRKLKIIKENQTMEEVGRLKELLRQLRFPLEVFTKKMLERSLAQSSKVMISGGPPTGDVPAARNGEIGTRNDEEGLARKLNEVESNLNKVRARLANRNEEVNQLRAIMKARQTTVDVTISSLKSRLDGQKRAQETELNQYKHKIKTIRKERDEQISLGALTSRRCQEYIHEIGKVKRRVDELRGEGDHLRSDNKLLSVFLERAIKQKLCISQELERYREEEERTRSIPLTLTSSRV